MRDLPVLSHPVETAKVGTGETTATIEATEREKADLAAALGLVDLSALSAEITLTRGKRGVILVDGRVRADIVQSCVVSLDPVPQQIDETISRRFVEEGSRPGPAAPKAGAEVMVEPMEDDEPPDLLTGPVIDVGAIVVEHFVLAIDPYPRARGAALPDSPVGDFGADADSPFAALAKLRGSGSKDG
jgi:uncharacterized metal-binding protein YceD (DUF177 family)